MKPSIWRERRRWLVRSGRVLFSPALALSAGALAGGALVLLLGAIGLSAGALAAGFALGLVAVAAPIGIAQRLAARVIEETHRTVNMRPLVGDALLGTHWAMDAAFAYEIARLVDRVRPSFVFECGSGMSTVLIAERLRRIGAGRVLAVENDAGWAEATRDRLAAAGLGGYATVVHAPLVDRDVSGSSKPWYAPVYETELTAPIDMLIVDGPGRSGELGRYPAVPLLRDRFAEDIVILLDDGDRSDVRVTAERWARELPAWLLYRASGRGRWLVWRGRRDL